MRFIRTIAILGLSIICLSIAAQPSDDMIRAQEEINKSGEAIISLDPGVFSKDWHKNGIYIDHGPDSNTIKAYINQAGHNFLSKHAIPFKNLPKRSFKPRMKSETDIRALKSDCLGTVDFYPTYEAYEQIMQSFAEDHPDLCRLIELGTLSSGRKILAVQISDHPDSLEREPNFFYTATMHGDELVGFPVMLQLIDHLLCNYPTDDQIRNLVDNINIYINPLANPDGTYRGGNATVAQATRFNASFADLNRNFPDPDVGDNPDGRSYQEETEIFMAFAQNKNIHLSCNIHSGSEVANYPWDTYSHLPADADWWEHVCRNYADTVHAHAPPDYFRDLDNGVTNGFAWYEVKGGRQDYMTYFHRDREFTLEISDIKLLPEDQIQSIWTYNKSPLLNYMEEALLGLRGEISDCLTGQPLRAEISIPGFDMDNSSVYSDSVSGMFHRFLTDSVYTIVVEKENYESFTQTIDLRSQPVIDLNVALCPENTSAASETEPQKPKILSLDRHLVIQGGVSSLPTQVALRDITGQVLWIHTLTLDRDPLTLKLSPNIVSGMYVITLETSDSIFSQLIFIR